MRSFITGGCGFVGRHLANHLVSCGDDVAASYHPEDRGGFGTEGDIGVALPKVSQTLALDVTDKKSVADVIALLKPDAIYHLAGVTFVPQAEKIRETVFGVNFDGTLNLLDAVVEHSPQTRVLFVSSAEVYGDPWPGTLPLLEVAQHRPVSVYGLSKSMADIACFTYAFRNNVDVVRVRPFPHIGPGQSQRFAISNFARQVALIKLGKAEAVVKVGNLEAKRDYSDVSDIVRGYREALLNGKRGEAYNLCSGSSVSIGDLLNKLIQLAEVEAEIEVDPERLRPVDIADHYGSNQKALKEFGWKPRIDIDGTLNSLLAFWLERESKK